MAPALHPHPRYAVALYRVSTAEQGHSGLGLEAQQTAVRSFVAAQGWTMIGEFSDIASDHHTLWVRFRHGMFRTWIADGRYAARGRPAGQRGTVCGTGCCLPCLARQPNATGYPGGHDGSAGESELPGELSAP